MKNQHVLKQGGFFKPANSIMVDLVIFDTPNVFAERV
jgi:hypothetical protein